MPGALALESRPHKPQLSISAIPRACLGLLPQDLFLPSLSPTLSLLCGLIWRRDKGGTRRETPAGRACCSGPAAQESLCSAGPDLSPLLPAVLRVPVASRPLPLSPPLVLRPADRAEFPSPAPPSPLHLLTTWRALCSPTIVHRPSRVCVSRQCDTPNGLLI